jgi:DNA-binding MarR family transcriptional regulator
MLDADVLSVQISYPQIYRACHTRHRRAASSAERLSERDGAILAHLDAKRPATAALLARHLGVGQPALSAALVRLTRLGFVERCADPRDRRREIGRAHV